MSPLASMQITGTARPVRLPQARRCCPHRMPASDRLRQSLRRECDPTRGHRQDQARRDAKYATYRAPAWRACERRHRRAFGLPDESARFYSEDDRCRTGAFRYALQMRTSPEQMQPYMSHPCCRELSQALRNARKCLISRYSGCGADQAASWAACPPIALIFPKEMLAGGAGFEPTPEESVCVVLALDDPPFEASPAPSLYLTQPAEVG